jgi:hypothetical protein
MPRKTRYTDRCISLLYRLRREDGAVGGGGGDGHKYEHAESHTNVSSAVCFSQNSRHFIHYSAVQQHAHLDIRRHVVYSLMTYNYVLNAKIFQF